MKKFKTLYLYLTLILAILGCSEKSSGSNSSDKGPIRKSAVAGTFYPGSTVELDKTVTTFLDNAKPATPRGELFAMVVPHAGYVYSGQVAAYGFKNLVGKNIDTVILIGNSHHAAFRGISIFGGGSFETPLGQVEVDSELAAAIKKESNIFNSDTSAHIPEHSIEVELPFLQKTLKNFKIVPILFGNTLNSDYKILAEAIVKNIQGKNVLLIASSDLSHYPSYRDAKIIDEGVINAILSGNTEILDNTVVKLSAQRFPNVATVACGIDAIEAVMAAAKMMGANEIKLLNAANSGNVSNERSKVVGYATIGFFRDQ